MYYVIVGDSFYTSDDGMFLKKIYPNNVVNILPNDYETGKYIVQNGELVINPEYESIRLERIKEDKITLNDELRDSALLRGVTYSNVLFDSDTEQKTNLTAKFLMMSDTDTVTWFGMDNQALLCSKQDLFAIGQLIEELHSFCWQNNAYIKEQISNAETVEELEAIEIDYGG